MTQAYDVPNLTKAEYPGFVNSAFVVDNATRVIVVRTGPNLYTVKARFDGPGND